jgi:hypothetical protein
MLPPAHLISISRYFQSRRGRKIGAEMSHKFSKHIMVAMRKAYPALYMVENKYGEWNLILTFRWSPFLSKCQRMSNQVHQTKVVYAPMHICHMRALSLSLSLSLSHTHTHTHADSHTRTHAGTCIASYYSASAAL